MAGKQIEPKPPNRAAKKIQQPVGQLPTGYGAFLEEVKARIRSARVKAALAVNAELISLYWDIGCAIVERQGRDGWGKSIVKRLSEDLRREFPGQTGLSPQNLWYMRSFYLAWSQSSTILQRPVGETPRQSAAQIDRTANLAPPAPGSQTQEHFLQVVRQIPWGQNIDLITKIKDPHRRFWYAHKTIENGWSRAVRPCVSA